MGMTDLQFLAYLRKSLQTLEQVKKEIETEGKSSTLEREIRELQEQLKKP